MKNKNLTELVFILDRSGSMSGLESDTIGGYNSLVEKQKKETGEAVVTLVLFDDKYDIIYDHADINKVNPITNKEYFARGSTALLDAIGKTINRVGNRHKYAPDNEVPGKTMVVIITDGFENASEEFNTSQIKAMIERQKNKFGWEFLFLGANIDAVDTASKFGISPDRAVTYEADRAGTTKNYEAINYAASTIRQSKEISDDWKKDIEEYRRKKNR